MKKRQVLFIVLSLIFVQTINASVWRVNNRPAVDADFTSLQDAIDGASSGDTLYIEGSTTSYGDGTFDKQLTVIGPGYWLDENDTTQAYKEISRVELIVFNPGSENSKISGLYIYKYAQNTSFKVVTVNADGISITKNYIGSTINDNATQNFNVYSIYINGNLSNINISNNWVQSYNTNGATLPTSIHFSGIPTNSIINNNIIRAYSYTSSHPKSIVTTNSTSNELVINNNVIWGAITTYYSIHVNNILVEGSYNNGTGDQVSYNLCNGTQYPNANSNQQNIDMSTVFVDYTTYIDNGYILASGSPAIGAGVNGGDCGAFGNGSGGNPYILSGIPAIPAVFDATVAPIGASSLPVNIKATTHNSN